MAKAKNKPRGANKYEPPTHSGAPGWIWFIAGLVIGCFIMFLMKLEPKKDIRSQKPDKTIQTNTNSENKTEFVFQKILSGKDVPQQPLTEEQRKKLDGERAAAILENRAPTTTQVKSPTTQRAVSTINNQPTQQSKPSQVAVVTPPTNMNFFLQIGSYPTKKGAESTRAQALMAGQNAFVEINKMNNKTWYRVLVGPYKNRDAATKVQKQLASHGFSGAILVPRKAK